MSSTTGASEGSMPVTVVDQKKRKRMLSNRDSARRSRMRKQQRLDELSAAASELRDGSRRMSDTLQVVSHSCRVVEAENRVLRTRAMELRTRLESLNSILMSHYTSATATSCNYDSCFSVPWNLLLINHSTMAPVLDTSFLV